MKYFIMSNHVNFIAYDGESLIQTHASSGAEFLTIEAELAHGSFLIEEGPLSGFTVKHEGGESISLKKEGYFLCANEGAARLVARSPERLPWETFFLTTPEQFEKLKKFNKSFSEEKIRFRDRVNYLAENMKDIKIYCGCGTVPREGFINLDIRVFAPDFALKNPDDYFLFDFADSRWPIEDNSVDFIFDEDFIEHIDQITQMQYLAETRRVLKPECYHRINTPNLLTAMKRHSNFDLGVDGVYAGEREHGHIAMFSPWSLKEMSELVGYREIVFETRGISVSPYAVQDTRPWSDRDSILGNIYAELLK